MLVVNIFMSKPDIRQMKAARDVQGLVKALGYRRDCDIRSAAADALGRLGDATAIQPLVQALRDKFVRWEAAMALERIGEPAIGPLSQTVSDTGDIYVRKVAERTLQRISPN